jgi:hypothetical protein
MCAPEYRRWAAAHRVSENGCDIVTPFLEISGRAACYPSASVAYWILSTVNNST